MTLRILAIDDSRTMREMLKSSLSAAGFEVHTADDGLHGLDRMAEVDPDVVITDINMPRLDGFGVIEELRQDPKTREIPIVILTAKSLSADEEKNLEERIYTVIQKQGLQGEALLKTNSSALTQPKTT